MTNEQILKKVIEKAVKNGYKDFWVKPELKEDMSMWKDIVLGGEYYSIIYSHSFAKTFWGEEIISSVIGDCPAWQWHLCKMVREEEPLKYIAKFL